MKNLIIFDGHCDTAVELQHNQTHLPDSTGQVSLRRAEKLGGYLQFYAFCTVWQTDADSHAQRFDKAYTYFRQELADNADKITLCTDAAMAAQALADGKCGAFLSIEGAEAIGCDPGRLAQARELGIRMIAPTWNHANALSGSCMTGEGMTAQGREFVKQAQRLGVILDVSHLSERGFWELCELAEKPIVASHSNSKAMCNHVRNLTDEQFLALCQLGGTAGINLYSDFLSDSYATFDTVYRHIDHFLELGGPEHVALGGDLDGCDTLPEGFDGVDSYVALADYLKRKGYTEATLRAIYSESLLKVVKLCSM